MCASPSSSLIYLPRNLSYCNNNEETHLGTANNHNKTELNITAVKLRQRVLYPHFEKIMSEITGDKDETLMIEDVEKEEDICKKCSDQVTSFDEGIFINLMDDLNLDSEPATATTMAITEDSAASSSTETSELQSPLPGIIVGGSSPTVNDTCDTRATHSSSSSSSLPGGHSLDEIVCGETPMAGICAESPCLGSQSSSPGRNIVSSVQSFFSGNPKNDTKLLDLLSPASPIYDDDEFNFPRGELRKSTSLKSNKTPPGTPRRKKVVRFADVMGLDLESVIHVLNMDSPPKIPASALADLQSGIEDDRKSVGARLLTACFSQPSASDGFMARVCTEKVCLENAVISDLTITGIIRVANIGFHKSVQVRYTTNSWSTYHDVAASYVHSSCDGPTDRFSFSIVTPPDFSVGSRLEFAISYTCGDVVYWDNNHNVNYLFECYAKTGLTEAEEAWMHFL